MDTLSASSLEFTFATVELRTLCERRGKALALMGQDAALKLSESLADMAACDSAAEFDDIFLDDIESMSLDAKRLTLVDGWTLTLRAAHLKPPLDADGKIDWSHVTRVMIVALEGK